MITLLLLHPLKHTPIQVWPFSDQTVIRLGRSTDNDVVLYSAVVSRHHVELCYTDDHWEVINLGTNGTYVDGKRITKTPVKDGAIIRLARSGPNVQVRLGDEILSTLPRNLFSHPEERLSRSTELDSSPDAAQPIPAPGSTAIPKPPLPGQHAGFTAPPLPAAASQAPAPKGSAATDRPPAGQSAWQTVRGHQIQRILGQGDIGITYLAELAGRSVVLKTLNASWVGNDAARAALDLEANLLRHVQHPRIPQVLNQFQVEQQPYLVMEHIEGDSLTQHVTTHGAVSLRQAIAWMVDLCRVLTHLHSFTPPALHRNIEPANLIRRPTGELALIGFGTIKALALERLKTVGATGFIAPTQLQPSASAQVDIYPIAATLTYLISGQNPLRFCERNQNRYLLNPSVIPNIPVSLQRVLASLTQGKYQSAQEVASSLREAV
ncbi:MAG: FHA domain-containing serine/threonine-protein kinase [Cyanobacteria bacterium P01_A01_bin.135]